MIKRSLKATNIIAWGGAVSAKPQERRTMFSLPEGGATTGVLLVAFSDRDFHNDIPRVSFAMLITP
jgi:hypothetical protein